MDRWGVSRCDAVEMDAVSNQLTRLIVDDDAPPEREEQIDRICGRRHSLHETRLEEAIAIAGRAEAAHRMDDAWPHGLADDLADLLDRTVVHQQREQAVVFPMLMSGVGALSVPAIEDMIGAHEDLLKRWRRLEERTGGFKAPAHACAAWRLLYVICCKLHLDCSKQVELENRMLLGERGSDLRKDPEAPVACAQRP